MDIQKYLNRIGIKGKSNPTLAFLQKLQKAHLLNIPFENLDIHYGNKIELNADKLFKKVVINNRGGFCYELNGLFYELLNSLEFNVKRISAKVYNKDNGYGKEFDHLVLIVNINSIEYLADVGFGEFSLAPLKFELQILQHDKRGKFFFDRYDEKYFRINRKENNQTIPQYIFKTEGRKLQEFNSMCKYHQSSKESHFTQKKVITLPTENGRITLNDDKLKITENGISKESDFESEKEFEKNLWEYFKIKI